MRHLYRKAALITAFSFFYASGIAQQNTILIRAIDGATGKVIANEHLLVFTGESISAVQSKAAHVDLLTDKNGVSELKFTPTEVKWMHVLVDWHTPCQNHPNEGIFSLEDIKATGLQTPNTCGKATGNPMPNEVIIFARKPSVRERLDW